MTKVIGYYNKNGYTINDVETGEELYCAGNNPLESTGVIENGLPLETIKQYCEQTGKEIAVENNAEFIGIELTFNLQEETMKTRKTEIVVRYHNFKPDYSLTNNKGGYCRWTEIADTMKDAYDLKAELESRGLRVSSMYRRTIKD